MNKTIIAIYGGARYGKSTTLSETIRILENEYPNARFSDTPDYTKDNFLSVDLGTLKIGFESNGDPKGRLLWNESLKKLADRNEDPLRGGCDIIVCATRTEGKTVKKVDEIARLSMVITRYGSAAFGVPG